jgi:hypothetical protein
LLLTILNRVQYTHSSLLTPHQQKNKKDTIMKTTSIIAIALVAPAAAFSGSSFTGSSLSNNVQNSATMTMEYIPR